MNIYVALVHHPVKNRLGETVSTAVTNLDIHDLARACRTYGVRSAFIVTPIEQQRSLVDRIIDHWQGGDGATFNPIRAHAFATMKVAASVAEVAEAIEATSVRPPMAVATGANLTDSITDYPALRARISDEDGDLLLLFGTGWGLTDDIIEASDLRLPPIRAVEGRDGYNHLSVRSAVSIVLDRLLGAR